MEDRYEIRGKIGQGGLGSVYRAYDRKMNREVAIKRITTGGEDGLAEESTRQLLKEAGALASLQHPHIVTVHDFGSDEDGPYVVMELILGKTLDDIILHAPLTWLDFRELAMQTQEALIAAQDLDLIHSDLKPSNLMLTWLPSGKFQVKVVDFGLAVLTQSQCRKEIEAMDAVFGSIFFMPPEQFERQPLNPRSDMYSIGCVYYQAFTGQYPFNGRTANEVMEAHLQHSVIPLHELREDIPQWVCDWVMWHINRYPQDRPESARTALALFLQNDRVPNPPMSRGKSQSEEPKRPKLIIPSNSVAEAAALPTPPAPTPVATQEIGYERPKLLIPGAQAPIQDPTLPEPQASPSPIAEAPPLATTASVGNFAPATLTAAVFAATPAPVQPALSITQPQLLVPAPLQPIHDPFPEPVAEESSIPTPASIAPAPLSQPTPVSAPVSITAPVPTPSEPAPAPTTASTIVPPQVASAVAAAAAAAAAAETSAPEPPTPATHQPATDGSEPANPITSRTRSFARPKLVLNKHSADDMQKTASYSLTSITGLHPTIPSATSPQSLPLKPAVPTATPAATPTAPTAPAKPATPTAPAAPAKLAAPAAAPTAPLTANSPGQPTQPVSPQPLQPPAGSKPSIHSTQPAAEPTPEVTPRPAPKTQALSSSASKTSRVVAVTPTQVTAAVATMAAAPKQKRGVSNAMKGMIATALIISILIVSWVLVERMGSNRDAEILNKLIAKATQANATEVPVNQKELEILLGSAVNVSLNKHRSSIYKALLLAKSSDGKNIDDSIAKFVTTSDMLPEVKKVLIENVLQTRKSPSIVPTLLTFASTTTDTKSASYALKAIRDMVGDQHFDPLLKIIQNTTDAELRRNAEETLATIIRKSNGKEKLANSLSIQYATALNNEIRHCMLRLMGVCGGEKALATVREIFAGTDQQQIIAAIIALGSWGDATGFPALVDFLKQSRDPKLRDRAIDAAQKYLGQMKDKSKEGELWNMLAGQAKTREEKMKILQGIANLDGEWPLQLAQSYSTSDDEEVAAKAKRALSHMQDMRKLNE